MTEPSPKFCELCKEAGISLSDERSYQEFAGVLINTAVGKGFTAQDIAKIVTLNCESAIAEHQGDQEMMEVVIEEIVETISETVDAVKKELEKEDLGLFEKDRLFEGDFYDERFPVNNFVGKVKIEEVSIIKYGEQKGGAQLLFVPEKSGKEQAIVDFWLQKTPDSREANKLMILSVTKHLEIQCKSKEELNQLERYINALIIEAKSKVEIQKGKKKKVIRDFEAELGKVYEELREAEINLSKWEYTRYEDSLEGRKQKEEDRKRVIGALAVLRDKEIDISIAQRKKEDKKRIFGIK